MKYWIFPFILLMSCSGGEDDSQNGTSPKEKPKEEFQKDTALSAPVKNNTVPEDIEALHKKTSKNCLVDLDAYIDDPSETATNVRQTPGGKVVLKLPYAQDDYFLTISGQQGDWFKISAIEGIENKYEWSGGEAWIHNSVVGASTRNYGNQKIIMYDADNQNSNEVGTITMETALQVIAVCGDWVKVKTKPDQKNGWIKKEWICGNPLTTCS